MTTKINRVRSIIVSVVILLMLLGCFGWVAASSESRLFGTSLGMPGSQDNPKAVAQTDGPTHAKLRILSDEYPRVFFFRQAEGVAAHKTVSYEQWEKTFERLMGIEGKVLDEEVPGRSQSALLLGQKCPATGSQLHQPQIQYTHR